MVRASAVMGHWPGNWRPFFESPLLRISALPRWRPVRRTHRAGAHTGGSGVVVGELEAVLGELVKVGRFDLGLAVGSDFAVAEIVGENEDDVGFFGSVSG